MSITKNGIIPTTTLNMQENISNYAQFNSFLFSPNKENERPLNNNLNSYINTSQTGINENSKLCLLEPNEQLLNHLRKDLSIRLEKGLGEIRYSLGISNSNEKPGLNIQQLEKSRTTLSNITNHCESDLTFLRRRQSEDGAVEDYLIRKRVLPNDFLEVRIAVVGNVDAGKSTLLGVLTHGDLDNGRGHSRQKLFRHKHEIESGRTSSVGNDILGFDSKGNIVNQMEAHNGHIDWKRICQNSAKVITFIDLAGHEKYLKTTIFGMTGHYPDFVMLMIGANAGIVGMTKEHLGLALALNMPVFVVLTKTDMCPANVLADNVKLVAKVLKSAGCRKIPIFVNSNEDVVKVSDFVSQRTCPIFQVSNVTGQNIDLLKSFLNLLTPSIPSVSCSRREHFDIEKPAELLIDDYYQVPGVGTVVSGTCINGIMKVGDTFLLGPDRSGNFNPVNIRSIHRKRMPVEKVSAGQSASMALKKVRKNDVRKGMVLVSPAIQPKSYWEFNANVLILHHPTTIKPKYQAMIHCGSVRQTATLLEMSLECLRTGDRALVRFRFTKQPEFLRCGQKIVFREGRTKAIGSISELL